MIITKEVYKTRRQAEDDYASLIRTIIGCDWLCQTARHLGIPPYEMYEVIKVGDRQWRINATPEHLAATQKFYKIA